jgi:phosphatidylglycerol lysyltransferase
MLLGLTAIWLLLRPGRVRYLPWDSNTRELMVAMGPRRDRSADGVVLGESSRAGLPFRRYGRVLLGLGDPVGDETDRVSAIWRLRDLAEQEGLDAAVWQAGPDLLQVYADIGLTALPLGPDGLPLPESESETPVSDQYLVCKAERDLNFLLPVLPLLADDADWPIPSPDRAFPEQSVPAGLAGVDQLPGA